MCSPMIEAAVSKFVFPAGANVMLLEHFLCEEKSELPLCFGEEMVGGEASRYQ